MRAHARGIRKVRRRRVGVYHPEQPAAVHDEVRIPVVVEERRDLLDAVDDLPVKQDAAVFAQLIGDEDLHTAEAHGEQQAPEPAAHVHAARPLIRRHHIPVVALAAALGVVELGRVRAHEHVVARLLAEVEAGLGDRQVGRGLRRQVAHEEHGQAFGRHLIDRAEREAVAVREAQAVVHPRLVRQAVGVEFARREHHLTALPVDPVAVVVDRHEVVVRADFLDLRERLEQGLMIPEPHVRDRLGVGDDVFRVERVVAGQFLFVDAVEAVGLPRRMDVVDDVRLFFVLFVRGDDELLDEGAVHEAADVQEHHQDDGDGHGPAPRAEALPHGQHGADGEQDHLDAEDGQHGVRVGVGRAEDHRRRVAAGGRDERAGHVEPRAPGHQREGHGDEPDQMRARARREAHGRKERDAEARRDRHRAREHVDAAGAGQCEQREREGQLADRLEDRQPEDVEAHVVMEQRVLRAERYRAEEHRPAHPVGRGRHGEHRRDDDRADRRETRQAGAFDGHGLAVGAGAEDQARGGHPDLGETQVPVQKGEAAQEHAEKDKALRVEGAQEHARVADLDEPEPVGVVERERRDREQHDRRQYEQARHSAGTHPQSVEQVAGKGNAGGTGGGP